jgi:AcrR family transcriptional regulator
LVYFERWFKEMREDVRMGSTRKAGRPRTPAADRILWAASEMFYREGIRAVGVDAIAAEADVTKKTLYEKFGSKDGLVVAYLRARDERWRAWLRGVVERQGGSARERLLSTFDALGEWMERENPRGCGFVNAAAELPHADHPARTVVMEQKRWLRGYLAELAAEGGAEDPEDLAERLLILHEGATVAYSLEMATDAAQKAKQTAVTLVADLQ